MNANGNGFITFLSDYGLSDEFVGVCHGVMLTVAPQVRIIDITHGIAAQDVVEGAMVLAQSLPYMPSGVHLAIVDPGVGGKRIPVIVSAADGSTLIGPNNGLLALALDRLGRVSARKIENPDLMEPKVSNTFHGRDVFAPAAAHVANGVPIEEFGEEISLDRLEQVTIPDARRHDDHFHAMVLHRDRFGNMQLNVSPTDLAALGLSQGDMLEVRVEGHRNLVPFGRAYSDVPHGDLIVTEDSYGQLAIAANRANAAQTMGATLGSSVIIGPPGSGAGD